MIRHLSDLILKAAGEGIYGLDREGRATFINPAAAQMLGWEPDDLIGKPLHKLIHHTACDGSAIPLHECPIFAVFTDGVVRRVDHDVFWRKDGSSFDVEYVSTPIICEQRGLLGAVVTFSDITARRAAEQEMADLRRHNESILGSAGEGIYGLDADGCTTFVNPAAEKILGWSAEELLGKPQHDITHHTKQDGSTYDRHDCPIYAAFTDGAVHRVDDELFWHKDGRSIPVEYVSTPVRDENGTLTGAVVTFNDITERKRHEKALKSALAEVERLKERLQQENQYLRQEIKVSHNFEEMVGQSEAMTKAKRLIEQVAATDATVLVLGETGVGKELFARAIHNMSSRKERTLVKVNCAALPSTLIESELFGHEKGAFTGATAKRTGRFELADGGTIFLDEIGELSLELQAKLLRVLQEGEFERLGSGDTIKVDIRIVAATNRDLSKMVLTGDFRDDLYYRLNVFPVKVPPLRERREDIPPLVTHFAHKFASKCGKQIDTIPGHVQASLQAYDWPGNIRELENVIERAVILTNDSTLHVDDALDTKSVVPGRTATIEMPANNTDQRSLEQIERAHILEIFEQTNWRISGDEGAAVILDLHPNTLRSRMKKLGLSKADSGI
jgi:PAS domain S-box-containing protein